MRTKAWVFGSVYLALIPTFAWWYSTIPDDFYHPTAAHEEYLAVEEREILDGLRKSVIANYVASRGSRDLPKGYDLFTWDQIRFADLRHENSGYSFAMIADIGRTSAELPPTALRLQFVLFWPRKVASNERLRNYILTPQAGHGDVTSLMQTFFPLHPKNPNEIVSSNIGYLTVSSELEEKLKAWAKGVAGFPSRTRGNFDRMLYLSAITITTVGYGDILPLTKRARLSVAAEAVLGVVFIGLFLNALAHRAAGR